MTNVSITRFMRREMNTFSRSPPSESRFCPRNVSDKRPWWRHAEWTWWWVWISSDISPTPRNTHTHTQSWLWHLTSFHFHSSSDGGKKDSVLNNSFIEINKHLSRGSALRVPSRWRPSDWGVYWAHYGWSQDLRTSHIKLRKWGRDSTRAGGRCEKPPAEGGRAFKSELHCWGCREWNYGCNFGHVRHMHTAWGQHTRKGSQQQRVSSHADWHRQRHLNLRSHPETSTIKRPN